MELVGMRLAELLPGSVLRWSWNSLCWILSGSGEQGIALASLASTAGAGWGSEIMAAHSSA